MIAPPGPIGFIGIGNLGFEIASRLVASGYELLTNDIRKDAMMRLVGNGATAIPEPCSVAERAEIVFLCLPDSAAVKQVLLGPKGALRGARGSLIVDLSTIGPDASRECAAAAAEARKAYLDAPVSGGVPAARAGTLTLMAAGEKQVYEQAEHSFGCFTANRFYIGNQPGQAQLLKLVNNLLAAANLALAMEAVVCGVKGGLDARMMLEAINVSSGRNTGTLDKLPKCVLTRSFDWGANTEIIYKDLKLLMQEAERLGVPLWLGSQVTQMWQFAMTQGDAQKDFTNLIRHMEKWAGVTVRG